MSFFPSLQPSIGRMCYHGGRVHENKHGYVDNYVIDDLLAEKEEKLFQYLEKMRYRSAPPPLGWANRAERNLDGQSRINIQPTQTHHNINAVEDDDEDIAETQDEELILEDDDVDDDEDEDMEMEDDIESAPPSLTSLRDEGDRVGPIQTVNLTSFLASPIEAPLIRPPQRMSTGEGSATRRRYSLPRGSPLDFQMSFSHDDTRRSSIMSTGSSLEFHQTPTRRFSFSSSTTRTPGNTSIDGIPTDPASASHEIDETPSNPLAWDYLGLR